MQAKPLIVIPAHNEAESISDVLDSLHAYRSAYDVIVIDDGSTDSTAQRVREKDIPILQLPANMGIGGAMQTGFKYAVRNNYSIVVQMDGDGQHEPAWLSRLCQPILQGEANCVIGSRYIQQKPDRAYPTPFLRRAGMKLSSLLLFLASGRMIHDTTSGFRALDRNAFSLFARDYPVEHPEAEAILILLRHGLTVKEIPVQMRARRAGRSMFTGLGAATYFSHVLIGFLEVLVKSNRR